MAKLVEVEGVDGNVGFIDPDDVRAILPATDGSAPPLPTEQDGIPIIGRDKPEVKAAAIMSKTPGAGAIAVNGNPATIAELINGAR